MKTATKVNQKTALTPRQKELLTVIKEWESSEEYDVEDGCYCETGRYKPWDYRTVEGLKKKGLIEIVEGGKWEGYYLLKMKTATVKIEEDIVAPEAIQSASTNVRTNTWSASTSKDRWQGSFEIKRMIQNNMVGLTIVVTGADHQPCIKKQIEDMIIEDIENVLNRL